MITEMHPAFDPQQPQAMAEMPRYKSHKTVWALKIEKIHTDEDGQGIVLIFENKGFAPKAFTADQLKQKPTPQPGWYMVQYEDGYISFSPAEQFEKGNTPEDSEAHHHGKSPDLRSFTQDEMDNWFSYHAPTPEQIIAYGEIRTAAKIFAETVNRHVPSSADKTAAMREIRGAVMAANLAVACFQKPKRPTIAELESILQKDADVPVTIHSDGSITADA
jgi:hypothetical protein